MVEDNIDFIFMVLDNMIIFIDVDCDYDVDFFIIGMVDDELDNCFVDLMAKYVDVIVLGSCVGEVIIICIWMFIDDCGNVIEQDQIIIVEDNMVLMLVCFNGVFILFDLDGEWMFVVEDVFDFSVFFDNCSIVFVMDISLVIIDCDDVGGLISIQVIVFDDCGNEVICIVIIEVFDIIVLFLLWEGVDIGNFGSGNIYSYNFCVDEFIIEGGVYNILMFMDNLVIILQILCSNGNGLVGIQLKVEFVFGGFGGVFICESNVFNVKYVVLFKQNDINLLLWECCIFIGGSLDWGIGGVIFLFWLRIFCQGNFIWVQYSNIGNNWILYCQIYLEMGLCVEVGMVVYIMYLNGIVDVVFSNVQVVGSSIVGINSLVVDQGSNGVLFGLDQEALFIIERMDLFVFLNLVIDQFILKFGIELFEFFMIIFCNQLGQIMKQEQLCILDIQMDWDIFNLSIGIYFFEVCILDGVLQVVKFLKI